MTRKELESEIERKLGTKVSLDHMTTEELSDLNDHIEEDEVVLPEKPLS